MSAQSAQSSRLFELGGVYKWRRPYRTPVYLPWNPLVSFKQRYRAHTNWLYRQHFENAYIGSRAYRDMTFASSALDEHDTQPLLRSFSHYADDPEPLSRSPSSSFSLSEYKAISTKHRDHSSSFSSSSYESPSDISSASQSDDLVEPDEEGSKFSALFLGLLWGGRGKAKMTEPDLDTCATKRSVFDDSVLARHYWPKDGYEGSAKFDVNARWSLREEKVS